jgi:hypothetical protein
MEAMKEKLKSDLAREMREASEDMERVKRQTAKMREDAAAANEVVVIDEDGVEEVRQQQQQVENGARYKGSYHYQRSC